MVILKKIRASTLVETLAASVIIIIVFVIGSLSLNNVFYTSIKKNDDEIKNQIKELKYKLLHNKIALPFYNQTDLWDISIKRENENMVLTVLNKKTDSQEIILIND